MKKIITLLAVTALSVTLVFAQEIETETVAETAITEKTADTVENEKVRLDIVAGDTLGTNIYSTVNTTNLALRVGLKENKIGITAGGMFREGFATGSMGEGFPLDFYWTANPYLGVEFYNVEILGGVAFGPESDSITPYVGAFYLFNLIKPETGFTQKLSLKLGLEYYIDQFTGKYCSSDASAGSAAIDVLSIIIPKVSVGIQYSFGWGF